MTFFWNGNRSGYLDTKRERFEEVGPRLLAWGQCRWCTDVQHWWPAQSLLVVLWPSSMDHTSRFYCCLSAPSTAPPQIPSDQGISFDQRPAMKAREIADATKQALLSGDFDFVRCNFANPGVLRQPQNWADCWELHNFVRRGHPSLVQSVQAKSAETWPDLLPADMVGHTGNLQAAIEAVSVTDACVKELLRAVDQIGGRFLLTADHGNAEDMVQVRLWGGWGCGRIRSSCCCDITAFSATMG